MFIQKLVTDLLLADEYVFIKLTAEDKFSEFYAEAESIMINA